MEYCKTCSLRVQLNTMKAALDESLLDYQRACDRCVTYKQERDAALRRANRAEAELASIKDPEGCTVDVGRETSRVGQVRRVWLKPEDVAGYCDELREQVKIAEARPCVEHCREERAMGNGGCGACSMCCREMQERVEKADDLNHALQDVLKKVWERFVNIYEHEGNIHVCGMCGVSYRKENESEVKNHEEDCLIPRIESLLFPDKNSETSGCCERCGEWFESSLLTETANGPRCASCVELPLFETEMSTRDALIAIRGGLPPKCDFCSKKVDPDTLHPEEGGLWVCEDCLQRWEREEANGERA